MVRELHLQIQLDEDNPLVVVATLTFDGGISRMHVHTDAQLHMRLEERLNNALRTMCNQVLDEAKHLRKKLSI